MFAVGNDRKKNSNRPVSTSRWQEDVNKAELQGQTMVDEQEILFALLLGTSTHARALQRDAKKLL